MWIAIGSSRKQAAGDCGCLDSIRSAVSRNAVHISSKRGLGGGSPSGAVTSAPAWLASLFYGWWCVGSRLLTAFLAAEPSPASLPFNDRWCASSFCAAQKTQCNIPLMREI